MFSKEFLLPNSGNINGHWLTTIDNDCWSIGVWLSCWLIVVIEAAIGVSDPVDPRVDPGRMSMLFRAPGLCSRQERTEAEGYGYKISSTGWRRNRGRIKRGKSDRAYAASARAFQSASSAVSITTSHWPSFSLFILNIYLFIYLSAFGQLLKFEGKKKHKEVGISHGFGFWSFDC